MLLAVGREKFIPVLFYVNEEENILLKVTLHLGWVVSHYNLKSFYEFSCLNV